MANFLSQ